MFSYSCDLNLLGVLTRPRQTDYKRYQSVHVISHLTAGQKDTTSKTG